MVGAFSQRPIDVFVPLQKNQLALLVLIATLHKINYFCLVSFQSSQYPLFDLQILHEAIVAGEQNKVNRTGL